MTKAQLLDMAERVGSTAAEAGIGVAITDLSSLPAWWAVLLVPVLSAAKGWLASRMTGTASLIRSPTAGTPPQTTPPTA